MSTIAMRCCAAVGICLLVSSCGTRPASKTKPTVPVQGEVYVDGRPAAGVVIRCENVAGVDANNPTVSSAKTGEDGRFYVSTYRRADGAPEGQYALVFSWREYGVLQHAYIGPDKLKRRYSSAKNSTFRFKVEPGKPVDLGRIELTTR
jgi:hypothetical protein